MKGTYVIRGNDIFSGTGAGENQRAAIVLRAALTSGLVLIKQNKLHDNDRAGIGIQKDYTGIQIVENNIYNNTRGGIHTGVANSFKGTNGGAIVLIEKNRVHHNVSASYGGGIDVRHASGVIENNLVYGNSRGGIRFGDYVTEIINNTVANNGQNGVGGGIIYDDLAGAVNAQPGGTLNDSPNFPPDPLIRNNISAFNEKTGLRCGGNGYGCPENPDYPGDPLGDKYRDFNLLYSNNGTGAYDCRWDASYPDKRCVNKNYGGCGLDGSWNKYNPNDIMADPRFGDGDNIYTLKSDSPAKNAGDDGNDLGAYGGSDPMDDDNVPMP
jgi:hypothetical protein